jgi:hypothetical protein
VSVRVSPTRFFACGPASTRRYALRR